ncbi:hypothetical protein AVO44_18005 [Ruegeria profundi]|uniref:Capsular polysaccharide phosphotransferase SacB n=2 Tax=Ruegeria profundi TaxID=1685378 RepID=A0A0X3TNC5_9RHOB|nr:hypothetical protein AVO44_18005 [Ruegeria profundi]
MAKSRKLVSKPGLFFRDMLLNKFPIEAEIDINRSNTAQENARKLTKKLRRDVSTPVKKTTNGIPRPQPIGVIQASFPVDIVYTWVDLADSNFFEVLSRFKETNQATNSESSDKSRFENRDELLYSLRSIEAYAPWVNHIYIVTNGQVPVWLDASNKNVTIVSHEEIIPEQYLPTFNSHVIESCIHRIPGLSEHYIYFNDDVLLARPLSKTDFFTETGLAYLFSTNSRLPNGPKSESDTPTQWAAKNARSLIFGEWGCYLDTMFAHTFHPQRKSVAQDNESLFEKELHYCRLNRFRGEEDLLFTSFLNHHVGFLTGRGLLTRTHGFYFNIRQRGAINSYRKLLQLKGGPAAPASMCLNDRMTDDEWPEYEKHLVDFLNAYFPKRSSYEKPEQEKTFENFQVDSVESKESEFFVKAAE